MFYQRRRTSCRVGRRVLRRSPALPGFINAVVLRVGAGVVWRRVGALVAARRALPFSLCRNNTYDNPTTCDHTGLRPYANRYSSQVTGQVTLQWDVIS